MNSQNFLIKTVLTLLFFLHSSKASGLFREYIGAEFKNVKLSDVPINPNVNFHFILSFAIDYTTSSNNPSPTNGNFNVFWDTNNLTPLSVSDIKKKNKNVKVALSLGGNSVANIDAVFQPLSVNSWVDNAVSSLTKTIKQYNLDGIDIDYEHFNADSETFSECIGQLVTRLKRNGVISFASIAPFDNEQVKSHYLVLWKKYKSAIDYVNFQFYAYGAGTTMGQFLEYFERQRADFDGGKVIVSFATDKTSGGLRPGAGFFIACDEIKRRGELLGIFVWSADDSIGDGFRLEKEAQSFLANM